MKNKLGKISYVLFAMGLFALSHQNCYAIETVKAEEVLTKQDKIELENQQKEDNQIRPALKQVLGEEKPPELQTDRPEFQLKNWGDIIKEKRLKKQAAKEENTVNEKKEDLVINCSEMEYFEDKNELEARGKVEVISKSGTKVYADKAIYNKNDNTIQLLKNVSLLKGSATVDGDYMMIDLNEENAIMDEPTTKVGSITINAQEGYAYSDRIENLNGNIELNKRVEMELFTDGFSEYGHSINDTRLVDFDLKKQRSKPYKFKTKSIEIRPERDHDSMVMKDVDIYYGKRKILNVPSIEFFQDKEMNCAEVNFPPEFGSYKGLGMYLGMGYTFKLPKTFTFRATPLVSYGDSKFGVGAIGQLKSKKTRTEIAWSTSTNNILFDGKYKLFDKLRLDLGRHVYKDEGILGGNRAGYIAELNYEDTYVVKELGDAIFRHRASAGWVADYKRKHQEKNMNSGFRYRYQAELMKTLKSFGDKEQDMYLDIGAVGQVMATLYSKTGDTFGLFRVGPTLSSRVKRWNSNIMYTIGGIHGKSPYAFDEYRYGRQTVTFDESVICNRFLSLGYRGTLTPLRDNIEKDVLTENRFYAVVGPEDFKVAFSYDTIRQNMHFDFLFLLGTDNLDMKYDKLTVKNPDKLGKREKKESDRELNRVKVPENL